MKENIEFNELIGAATNKKSQTVNNLRSSKSVKRGCKLKRFAPAFT